MQSRKQDWKAIQTIGVVTLLVGIVIAGFMAGSNPEGSSAIPGIMFGVGFVGYGVGRFMTWWVE